VEEEEDEEKTGRVFGSRNHVSVSELHMGGFGGEERRGVEMGGDRLSWPACKPVNHSSLGPPSVSMHHTRNKPEYRCTRLELYRILKLELELHAQVQSSISNLMHRLIYVSD
jgi:hypothetical protein